MLRKFCALMVGASLVFAGCGKEDDKTILIGIVAKSQSNPVFQAAHTGAKNAAKELSAKYNVNVQIEILTPTDEDATKQAEAIESLTRRGAKGIAVSCSEARTVTPAIDKAVEKGIAVMCFDSDAPESKRFAFYGTDDMACGQVITAELAKAMNNKGTIAIIAGSEAAPNLQNRVKGVKAELAKHPEMKLLETGGIVYHPETPEKAAEAMQQAQRAHKEIEGWALIGGWPLFTNDALKFAPGTVKVVSCDALPPQLAYLKSGHVQALMAQDCYGWGEKSVGILLEKIINNKAPDPIRVVDPLTKVTKENVDEFGKSWDKWLGK
ncbi:MAG: substrate-binding domain-containing protein [Burkholderiales bacterium]|nr:substrate-binding domain-containing protein [Phycisphaerae bacterium]